MLAEHLHIKEEQVRLDSKLTDELGADSLDSIEIVMNLEEKFGIEISNEETQQVKMVSDIINIVENKINPKK